MSYYLVFLLCLSVVCLRTEGQENTACISPYNEAGSCINIKLCASLLKLLYQAKSNPDSARVLQESQCGRNSYGPLVCCPGNIPTVVTESVPKSKELKCGTPSIPFVPKVVGGFDAKEGQFPWNVALGYKINTKVSFRCGGSIISTRHILTAGHCITPELYQVRYGVLNLYDDEPFDVFIEKVHLHEGFAQTPKIINDIAIIKVAEDIIFSDNPYVRPICLPRTGKLRSSLFETKFPFIAGWGALWYRGPSSNRLQGLQIRVVPNDECRDIFHQHKQALIDNTIICAGARGGGQDSCQGDSGGPLMQPEVADGLLNFNQIGIISYGYGCAEPGYVGVYTRVTAFLDWIDSHLD